MIPALVASLALAQAIYTWTDAAGTVHYTDDPATIPKGAKAQKSEGAPVTTIEAPPQPKKPPPREAKTPAGDEPFWRARFREAHQKIADLEAQIDADAKIVGDNPLVVTARSRGRLRVRSQNAEVEARLARNRQQLEREKSALDALERRASFENVPREWRQ